MCFIVVPRQWLRRKGKGRLLLRHVSGFRGGGGADTSAMLGAPGWFFLHGAGMFPRARDNTDMYILK